MEELSDLFVLEVGADDYQLACVACRAFPDFVFARDIVEVEPVAVRCLYDALGSEDSSAHAEIELFEGFVEFSFSVLSRSFPAPCREDLVRVVVIVAVVVIVMVVVIMVVFVVVMIMMVLVVVLVFMIMIVIMVMMVVMVFVYRFFSQLFEELLLQ